MAKLMKGSYHKYWKDFIFQLSFTFQSNFADFKLLTNLKRSDRKNDSGTLNRDFYNIFYILNKIISCESVVSLLYAATAAVLSKPEQKLILHPQP